MPREKLTPAQAGRLGGLQAAQNLGAEGVRRRGSKGGQTVVEQFGKAHMTRLAHRRHGRLSEGKPNAAGSSGGARNPNSRDRKGDGPMVAQQGARDAAS